MTRLAVDPDPGGVDWHSLEEEVGHQDPKSSLQPPRRSSLRVTGQGREPKAWALFG